MWGMGLNYNYLKWVSDSAVRLGLKGKAFFRDDGSVKVITEGEERDLLFFVDGLKHSHYFEDFSTTWRKPENKFKEFSIS